jgi:serine/threonine-protein kinase
MGAVYLAEHPLIGKKVALKVIHRDLSQNREVVTRFFNEARAVNQIGNEHIVDISDFGQTPEGEYFFIMELLSGRVLGDVLEQERMLSPQRAIHVAAQIADALGASHAVGIIHRDLKPDNVYLVTKMGEPDFVKLLDFGLAKLTQTSRPNLTKQGVILGTPQYMAPEQCESKAQVDHRADIYALGILLYQMTTGTIPFDGNSMGEILVKHVAHPVPIPRAANPHIPPAIEQIILRCLAKRPEERFQSMAELRFALLDPDRWMQGGIAMAPQPTALGSQPSGMYRQLQTGPTGAITHQNMAPPPPAPLASAVNERSGVHPSYVPGPQRAPLAQPVAPKGGTLVLDKGVAAGQPRAAAGGGTKSHKWIVGLVFVVLAGGLATGGILLIKRMNANAATEPKPVAPVPVPVPTPSPQPKPTPPSPPPSPTPAVKPADGANKPIVEPLPPPPDDTAQKQVKILLTSDPPGAEIVVEASGVALGTTPLELAFPPGGEHSLVFRLEGYEDKRRVVRAAADTEIAITLDKKKSRRPKKPAPTDGEALAPDPEL